METSNTAAVFSWQQTAFVVAERLVKKVRSRTDERGGGYCHGFASTMPLSNSGESGKGRPPFWVNTATTLAGGK